MYAADFDASGEIDITDKILVWNSNAGKTGYQNGDANMNANTGNIDKNDFWLPNLGQNSQIPQ